MLKSAKCLGANYIGSNGDFNSHLTQPSLGRDINNMMEISSDNYSTVALSPMSEICGLGSYVHSVRYFNLSHRTR